MGASSFYGKSRLRQVERCVLRLMAAVRKKLQGHAEDPFKVVLSSSSVNDTGLEPECVALMSACMPSLP